TLLEGVSCPAASLRVLSVAQVDCRANSACVRSSTRRRCLSHAPKRRDSLMPTVLVAVIIPPRGMTCQASLCFNQYSFKPGNEGNNMQPAQMESVRMSFHIVESNADTFADLFYARVFALSHEPRVLFTHELAD